MLQNWREHTNPSPVRSPELAALRRVSHTAVLEGKRGRPRDQYERTYVLAYPGADEPFMLKLVDMIWGIGERWTVGGSADDAGVGDLDVRRVIALRPDRWSPSEEVTSLEAFFETFYPGVVYWTLDWGNDYQLKGGLLAYSLKEAGFELAYPTTHRVVRVMDAFGRWRSWSGAYHCGLDLASSWSTWGDEVLSATDGVVVEAGWRGEQDGFGYRVRVRATAPDGRQVLIRYAHLDGENGVYVGVGECVEVGQRLGRPGSTGVGAGDHLHVDAKVGDAYVNPALLIRWPDAAALAAIKALDRAHPKGQGRIHTGVLLPCIEDVVERVEWRVGAAIGSASRMWAVGHPDGNGVGGPQGRQIVAVNPRRWGEDVRAYYARYYPDIWRQAVETESPWEMAVKLMPPLEGDIALAQTDPRWADYDFGEEPGADGGTIGRYGCFLTGLAIVLRRVYQREVTPPVLDKLLVAARAAYVEDNILMWERAIPLFPVFDDSIKDNEAHGARDLERLLRDGWEVILRRADGGHFVYLEEVRGDTLCIIDTWDGKRREESAARYRGVRAARVGPREEPGSVEAAGSSPSYVEPPDRDDRRCTYVLLPCIEDVVERVEWRVGAAIGSAGRMWAVGHPDGGDGNGSQGQALIPVNPRWWDEDMLGWYSRHDPGIWSQAVETESPWEMAVKLMPPLEGDIALAQTDPRWADCDFGEEPGADGGTIGRYGCFLTGLAIVLRRVYQREVTPPVLDKLLVAARAAYVEDDVLIWERAVPLFRVFDDSVKDDRRRSAPELERLLKDGWEVILRQADGSHFVYLEEVRGDTLCVIDTWDGVRKEKAVSAYAGIRAAHVRARERMLARPWPRVMVGLHDQRGGEWMAGKGLAGCCLVHHTVQRQPVQIDCRRLQEAGITVVCRLNWGYAGGMGTLPRPEDKGAFVDAVARTILAAQGVAYFHVGNEPNNRSEWPGFGSSSEFPLTAAYIVELYDGIWRRVDGRARLGPPPLDPYFGPGSNNRDWWLHILHEIAGADALFLHAKTQTNDPAQVRSHERFSDDPLTWQYLHLRTVETALAVVPDRFSALPVFVTELNPQRLGATGEATGWRADNGAWVREALDYFREEQPVEGVMFYRYEAAGDQVPFGLEDKPALLEAIFADLTAT